jgi:hypothetical protein
MLLRLHNNNITGIEKNTTNDLFTTSYALFSGSKIRIRQEYSTCRDRGLREEEDL